MNTLLKRLGIVLASMLLFIACTANAASVKELLQQANDPVLGNPKGDVTIVEFFDYQCSHCIDMAPVLTAILKANPNVRLVLKEFPIQGAASDIAARVALAARQQDKYAEMHVALFTLPQPLSEASILQSAKDNNLDMAKLKKDMASSIILNQLASNRRLGIALKLRGTPAFYIGKTHAINFNDMTFILGEMSQTQVQNTIDKLH